MILKALTLENFKGIRDPVRIEFGPITLLFGANSSGKSTVFQALQYARAVLYATDAEHYRLPAFDDCDLGGFPDLVNDHDIERPIVLRFDLDISGSGVRDYGLGDLLENIENEYDGLLGRLPKELISTNISTAAITIRIRWDTSKSRAYVSDYDAELNGVRFGTIAFSLEENEAKINWLNYCHPLLVEADPQYYLSYQAWLDDIGLSRDTDSSELEGEDSNTGLERFITDFNAEPWREKAFPIRIKGQRQAIPLLAQPLQLIFSEDLANPHRSRLNKEDIKMAGRIASGVISEGFLVPVFSLFDFLRNAIFLGPLRDIPNRGMYLQLGSEQTRWGAGRAAWDTLGRSNPDFVEEVNQWFSGSDKLDCGYTIELFQYQELPVNRQFQDCSLEDDQERSSKRNRDLEFFPVRTRLKLREKKSGVEVSFQDVGVGISQVLPVVVAALQHSPGALHQGQLVAIEQPELHIHPALQVRLGDLFANQVRHGDRMFLLETHSEHLMLRFLRRIRETSEDEVPEGAPSLKPQDIAVHFVEPGDAGPRIHRIRIDENGEFLDPWPRGFFRERGKELFG
jgi:hypothetical protein